ncbi:MAG: hypothetical protein ACI81O_000833 [Cyclobacteriaceae bacterium]|jgi:hypothetical protein
MRIPPGLPKWLKNGFPVKLDDLYNRLLSDYKRVDV